MFICFEVHPVEAIGILNESQFPVNAAGFSNLVLVGIPLIVAPSFLIQGFVRRRARQSREIAGRMSTRLDEVFHGINPIKLNALEAYQTARYDALTEDRVRAEVRTATGQAAIPALIDIMSGIGFLCVLLYGGAEIIEGDKTVGQFMSFFTAIGRAFDPMRRLASISGTWRRCISGVGSEARGSMASSKAWMSSKLR